MFTNSFSFKGRIRRKEYLISFLYQFIVLIHPYFFIYNLIKSDMQDFKINYTKLSINYVVSFIFYYIFIFKIYFLITEVFITPPLFETEIDIVRFSLIFVPMIIIFIWYTIAQSTKRCHDIGDSGWYQLIPFYGFLLLFRDSEIGNNEYGPNPKEIKNEISSIEIVNEIVTQNSLNVSIKSISVFLKSKIKKISGKNLSSDEVIIISVIFGSLFFLIFGNLFGETKYYREYDKEKIDFNYISAIISFIVTAGISYIYLNRKSNNTN